MRLLLTLLAVAASAVQLRAADEEPITFNQSYKPGHRYHQTMEMRQRVEIDGGSGLVFEERTTTVGMLATVTALEEQRTKRAALKYDALSASLLTNQEKYSFDSKTPQTATNAGPLAAYSRILGQEFQVVFDDLETVTDVENLEATIQSLSGNQPGGALVYQQLFTPDAVKRMMQQTTLRSGKPISVGGNWPFFQELPLAGVGKLIITGLYTFKGMVKHRDVDCAEVGAAATEIRIEIVGNVAGNDETARLVQQMMLKLETARMEGTFYYDPAMAFVREMAIDHEIVLTARLPDGSGKAVRLPMKQHIGISLDSFKSDDEVKKEEAAATAAEAKKVAAPATAGDPVKSEIPAKPEEPAKGEAPPKPEEPAKGEEPAKIGEPTKIAEPTKIGTPDKPGEPKKSPPKKK